VKVLFDSNIHISDAIHGGAAARAVNATLEARWKIFVCQTILTEIDRVIRIKFHRSRAFANATIQNIRDTCETAEEALSHHHVEGDPDDTPILRAAVSAGVDYLITGDAKLLELNPVEGVRIMTLGEYLQILESHGYK
jgi:putative PIN family toxin of toxin-antitoxin system